MSHRPTYILPLIVFSQFACTSLWFAGNAVLPDLQEEFAFGQNALANITSAVQLGFIAGTLLFALMAIADRFSPSKIFFASSLLAAFSNILIVVTATDSSEIMILRFITGFFLAGIYPIGMKIAADWFEHGLGKALGFLVGALVLGTALPHLLKGLRLQFSWQDIILFTSLFAATGGLMILLFVKDGPFRKKSLGFHPKNIATLFQSRNFRSAAFGYFGHMWELYTFWAFVPVLLSIHNQFTGHSINILLWSFVIIGSGFLSCIAGGFLAGRTKSAQVAFWSLLVSGICCVSSFIFLRSSTPIFLSFMILWGLTVISDSPQFSALVAKTATPQHTGTALTIVTCIGFSITILSIQLVNFLYYKIDLPATLFMLLGVGPVVGLIYLYRLVRRKASGE